MELCAGFFMALGNKTRLLILYHLRESEKSVGELVELTGFEQSLVSHNLRILKHCSLVNTRVEGKKRFYSLNNKTMKPAFQLLDQHMHSVCSNRDSTCPVVVTDE